MSNLDNENDFQQFLKGEGSLGSANTNHYNAYQQYGVQSNLYAGQPDRQSAYGAQGKQPYGLDPPQQLMMQMQESSSSQRPVATRQKSNSGLNSQAPNENKVFQNMAQNMFFKEKENINGHNIETRAHQEASS